MAALDDGAPVATLQSPLHSAALWNRVDEVKAMLEDPEVNIHAVSRSGNSALHEAAKVSLDGGLNPTPRRAEPTPRHAMDTLMTTTHTSPAPP